MAGTNLQQILGGAVLSGSIQKVKPGIATPGIPPALIAPTGAMLRRADGQMVEVITYRGSRQTARRHEMDAPARARSLSAPGRQAVKLIHVKDLLSIKASTLQNLTDENGNRQRLGESEVRRQLAEARQILDNTRAAAVISGLALGTISWDANGNILPSTASALLTVDWGVPAANKSQVARGSGSANLVTESWANASAKIVKHVEDIKIASAQLTGHQLKHAIYGSNVVNNILTNTQSMDLITSNNPRQNDLMQSAIPAGFCGLTWWPGGYNFWEDNSGTVQAPVGANDVIMFPEPSESWFEFIEGTTPVPTDMGTVSADIVAAMSGIEAVPGMFSYAYQTQNPVGAEMVYGDTFLPWATVPEAVFIATTVF